MVDEARVKYITEQYKLLTEVRLKFIEKYGFARKRPQNFKKCIVIRWKWVKKGYEINYPKLEEYAEICENIYNKYKLRDEKAPLMDSELKLIKIGIYSFTSWDNQCWAIPDENKEIQEYVLSKLPKWAKVSRKS